MNRSPSPARFRRRPALVVALALVAIGQARTPLAAEPPKNWPLPPAELERRFATQDFHVLEVKGAGGGVTGASKMKIRYDDGLELKVKWKSMPRPTLDGWNNSPRKELATYALQRMIFGDDDYSVPTVAPVCVPMAEYQHIDSDEPATVRGTSCVLGVLAVWLDDVDAPEHFYDKDRFAKDPAYAGYLADFNVLGYLVEHRDGRRGNLLLANDPADPRVFAVDNGIAFDPFPWNFFVMNWHRIRVPWLRSATIDRLKALDPARLDELGVVAELDVDAAGVLRPVAKGPNLDEDEGARIRGTRVQLGLTADEIEDVRERLEDLLEDVQEGDIALR